MMKKYDDDLFKRPHTVKQQSAVACGENTHVSVSQQSAVACGENTHV